MNDDEKERYMRFRTALDEVNAKFSDEGFDMIWLSFSGLQHFASVARDHAPNAEAAEHVIAHAIKDPD